MRNKSINTDEDVKGVLFLINHVMEEYYPTYSTIGSKEFKEITLQINEDYERKMSDSTIRRIFTFKTKPQPISYDKLDNFICWCFQGEYDNFKDFLKENKKKIENNSNLISDTEIKVVLKKIHKSKSKSILSNNLLTIELGSSPFQINLSEGDVVKLLKSIAHVTGDLLSQEMIKNPDIIAPYFRSNIIQKRTELKQKRQHKNIDAIVIKAIEYAKNKGETSDSPVDPDWVVDFFNIAQDCSNERMQYIWAKLLAGEIEKPGDFSRRTLQRIKLMSQYEALVFDFISRCIWLFKDEYNGDELVLILDDHHYADHYFDETFEFDGSDINNLENLGLIKLSYIELTKGEHYSLSFFGKEHIIGAKRSHYEFTFAALTPSGEEILSLIEAKPNEEYYKKTLAFFKKRNILIQ
jgi:uncharacterized repeat protein (TIGR03899 family)